jgi:HlyD family secretion protein
MKKRIIRFIALIVFLALAAGFFFFARGSKDAAASDFFTAPVVRGPLKKIISATGTIQTSLTVPVGSQVSGNVVELYADYNSVVKRQQLLAKLDTRNFEAAVDNSRAAVAAAQARVKSAEADIKTHDANLQSSKANLDAARVARDNADINFKRASELSQRGVASKNDYDTAKANFDSAVAKYDQAVASVRETEAQGGSIQASLDQAKAGLEQANTDLSRANINLEYASIYSPVDGVVIERKIDVGQTVNAAMQTPTLFTIATDLSQMQVDANIDEADIGSISEGQDVTFTVDAYPNDTFHGKIAEIRLNPQTVQNVVTYSVILAIGNPGMKLKPGMTANISVTVDSRDKALKVPNAALRYIPPNAPSQKSTAGNRGADAVVESKSSSPRGGSAPPIPLAPGQKWDPSNKVRFTAPSVVRERPAVVWVLGADRKPESHSVVLGLTDGTSTEIVSGELSETDMVVIGDNQDASRANQPVNPLGALRGFGGGGGGARR